MFTHDFGEYIYGHCEGCGMEYEYIPDAGSGILKRWHDAVGLVTTCIFADDEWATLLADHDRNCRNL